MPIEPLPSTGISTIVKLCETLSAQSGRRELYALPQDLRMPFDELLLVAKAAEMLALVEAKGNALQLQPLGAQVVAASAKDRKALLNQQMMKLQVFRHVVKLIENAKDHKVPAEVIREQIAVLLPQEQPRNLFTTLLNWGRFGEVFTYSREHDLFQLAGP